MNLKGFYFALFCLSGRPCNVQDSSRLLGQSWKTMRTRQQGVPSENLGLSSANPQPGLDLALFIFPAAEED